MRFRGPRLKRIVAKNPVQIGIDHGGVIPDHEDAFRAVQRIFRDRRRIGLPGRDNIDAHDPDGRSPGHQLAGEHNTTGEAIANIKAACGVKGETRRLVEHRFVQPCGVDESVVAKRRRRVHRETELAEDDIRGGPVGSRIQRSNGVSQHAVVQGIGEPQVAVLIEKQRGSRQHIVKRDGYGLLGKAS